MTAASSLVALFKTSKGTIKVNLFADKTPLTVASFVNLAQRGYYNGLNFHRVIPDSHDPGRLSARQWHRWPRLPV